MSASPEFVDDSTAAPALGVSVSWLRKDRLGRRLIPFVRIGGSVRYHLPTVRDALLANAEGGPATTAKATTGGRRA